MRTDKAAQAAAQAAQAAALQAATALQQQQQEPVSVVPQPAAAGPTPAVLAGMEQEQAITLLQKFGVPVFGTFHVPAPNTYAALSVGGGYAVPSTNGGAYAARPSVSTIASGNGCADAYRGGFQPSSTPRTSNRNGSVGEGYLSRGAQASSSSSPKPQFTEQNLKVRRDVGPFGYGGHRAYEVSPPAGGSLFSPDPNQYQQY